MPAGHRCHRPISNKRIQGTIFGLLLYLSTYMWVAIKYALDKGWPEKYNGSYLSLNLYLNLIFDR